MRQSTRPIGRYGASDPLNALFEIGRLTLPSLKCQDSALPPHIKYPFILGLDVAGTIVQLGSNVTRFKIGQRVIGYVNAYLKLTA